MAGYEVRMSDSHKGKGLFATRQYQRYEFILDEDPLVSCQFAWNAAYKYLACDNCLRPLETPEQNVRRLASKPDITLPNPDHHDLDFEKIRSCDNCNILYCCEECKSEAYVKYHRTLCYNLNDQHHPVAILLEAWKQMHYPPETTNILLLARVLAYIQQSSDPEAAVAEIKSFCHRTVDDDAQLVHKLLGPQFSIQLNTLRELTANVFSGDYVQEFLTPEGFNSLMALIGTNGQGIGTSPLSMWVNRMSEIMKSDDENQQLDLVIDRVYDLVIQEAGAFLDTEGSGLYKLQSACNHSCNPNAEIKFPYGNHRLQLKAKRLIQPGEEICISYLDECFLARSRHSRQKELAKNYLFICGCPRCLEQAPQPDLTSEEEMSESEEVDSDD